MFRSKQYCERYEKTPIRLDTPLITIVNNNASQQKNGYSFTIDDRSSYYDWFNGYFEVNFKINKLANGANYDDADQIAVINNAASLIDQLVIKQNGKNVYDCYNLYRVVNVRNLVELTKDYAETTGTNEFIALDSTNVAESRANQAGFNKGFAARKLLAQGGNEIKCKIPLNNYSFFRSLETNMLPPSQIQITLQLTNDNELIHRAAGVDNGRVIVTKLILWVPRLIFNAEGYSLISEHYLKAKKWNYLRERVTQSSNIEQSNIIFTITAGVMNPKHVFVYLQRANKSNSQEQNPHLLDTFKLNANNRNCTLQSCRLEVGNGVFYPETEYSSITRIYDDVIDYFHKQNDKNTGSLLNISNFEGLFGFIHFNLEFKKEEIASDPKHLTLDAKLNVPPAAAIRVYAIVMYEETVQLNTIGNEIVIV